MNSVSNTRKQFISIEIEGEKINFVNKGENIWFTKRQLSKIYGVGKATIKQKLENAEFQKIQVGGIEKKYYKIDTIAVLGYKLGKLKETRTLLFLNRYMKEGGGTETLLTRVKRLYNHIGSYSFI